MKRLLATFVSMLCMLGIQAQYDRQQILKVYNWNEYIGVGVIEKFEQWYKEVTGNTIKVEYTTYDYPEDMFAQILDGQADFDIFCPLAKIKPCDTKVRGSLSPSPSNIAGQIIA